METMNITNERGSKYPVKKAKEDITKAETKLI